jgi:hypothetical protein
MRKVSAILFICIFAFSQYARQFSYLGCIVSNTFKTAQNKCDCEKKNNTSKFDTKQSPVPTPHLHIHLDEYFTASGFFTIIFSPTFLKQILLLLNADDTCRGNPPKPWQPPSIS